MNARGLVRGRSRPAARLLAGALAAALGLLAAPALRAQGAAPAGRAQEPAPAPTDSYPAAPVREGTLAFDGKASLGDFTGTTHTVSGAMAASATLAGVRGWVEAPVATLETGNGRRDRDLNKSMESAQYPTIRFDLREVRPGAAQGDSTLVTLVGTLTLHGVAQAVELPARVARAAGAVRVRTDFPVNLKDYRIGGLSKMFGVLRMNEHIVVHVDVTFAPPG